MADKILFCLNCRTDHGAWDDDHTRMLRCSECGAAGRLMVLERGAPIPGDMDVDLPKIDPFKKPDA
jgi:hypothetical protein